MLPKGFFALIKWLSIRSSEHLDLPALISMEERFTCFQNLGLRLFTLQKGIIAQKCLSHLSASHVDRNVPECARKSYQQVSESGAAIVGPASQQKQPQKHQCANTAVSLSIILARPRGSALVSSYKRVQKQHNLSLHLLAETCYDRILEDVPY